MIYKHVILSVIAIICSSIVFAQGKNYLTGIVTDAKDGHPLPGATIRIHDADRNSIAGVNGSYKTASLPAGSYLVEVSFIGHQTILEKILIQGETHKDFVMNDAVVEQEEVIVTGVSQTTRLKQSPQPVEVMKRDDLLKTASGNIIDALGHLPGVSQLTTGPAISKPFIRGLGYNRVLVINDEIRQEGQQWGDEHGIEIDDYSVQRVEVLKGPASLMYGSDGLAGVINIHSLIPVAEGTIKTDLVSEYQTNSRLRGYYGMVAGSKNGFNFNAYGAYKSSADYRNKYDGYVFNSKFNNKNIGAMLGYGGSWGHSSLRVTNFDQQLGMVEGERDEHGNFLKPMPDGSEAIATKGDFLKTDPLVPYQRVQHLKVSLDNRFNLKGYALDVVMGYQQNQRREFGEAAEPDAAEAWFDLQTLQYQARLHFPSQKLWKTTIGISGANQKNTNKGEEALIPNYSLFDAGGFVFTQYHKEKTTISGGLRFDNRHINSKTLITDGEEKFRAFRTNFSTFSGSAGISYEATKELTLKLNAARGFRAPTLAELASNGAHEGTNRYEIGSRNLKPETSIQTDAGIEYDTRHITLSAGIFANNVNHFIYSRKLLNSNGDDSLITEDGDELLAFRFDQQDAFLYGAEFNMDIHPHPLDWLHFENTFSFTHAAFNKAVDGSRNIPSIPAAKLLSQLRGNFLSHGEQWRNFYLSAEADYTFKQNRPFTGYHTETATPAYCLLNISAGISFIQKGKNIFNLSLNANNVTDVAYQNHLSRLKYAAVNEATGRAGVFNMGRNFAVKLNMPLSFSW